MRFYFHIQWKNTKMLKNAHLKKYTRPANKFLLHECRSNRKMRKCKKKIQFSKKYTSTANEFLPDTVEAIGKLKFFKLNSLK